MPNTRGTRGKKTSGRPAKKAKQDEDQIVVRPADIEEEDEEISFHFTNSQLRRLLDETAEKAVQKTMHTYMQKGQTATTQDSSANVPDFTILPGTSPSDITARIMEGEKPTLDITGELTVDMHVTAQLRAKILDWKYINLADLLVKDPMNLETLNLGMTHFGMVGQPKTQHIYNVEQWDKAWTIYMTAYSRKEGNAARLPSLLKHRVNVLKVKQKKWRLARI